MLHGPWRLTGGHTMNPPSMGRALRSKRSIRVKEGVATRTGHPRRSPHTSAFRMQKMTKTFLTTTIMTNQDHWLAVKFTS